jgi:hypothetical protein
MKISIGSKFTDNPYGGGNLFIKNITNYLISKNHQVIDHLNDPDIDIILLINPLKNSEQATFNNYDIDYYLNFINTNALAIHRINECDQRKNTSGVNKKIIKSNQFIDHTVYVSSWLRDLYIEEGIGFRNNTVIYAGANENSFNTINKIFWDGSRKIKLVTHHWSSNPMKGWKDYKKIDKILNLMPTNLYGPNDHFNSHDSHVIPGLIYRMEKAKVNKETTFPIWGTGNPKREFLFVDDLSKAIIHLINKGIDTGLYNIGSGSEVSILELVNSLTKIIGYDGELVFDKSFPDGNPRKLIDSTKIISTGWTPEVDLNSGLQLTYDWFLKNAKL